MTKIGHWKSNKARKQDNARRRRKPPVGRTALPKPEIVPSMPFFVTTVLGILGTVIVIGAVVVALAIYLL